MPLVPVHDVWRLSDPYSFFDLSESLIILPVTVSENSAFDMIKLILWINVIFYPGKPI